jgi:hypothetical protein
MGLQQSETIPTVAVSIHRDHASIPAIFCETSTALVAALSRDSLVNSILRAIVKAVPCRIKKLPTKEGHIED